jgi:conserved oligomeric Golgi complex subunit 4
MFSLSNRRPPTSTSVEDGAVDPRDIDKLLSELAGMIGRWRLFRKFIAESLKVCFVVFRQPHQ